jgi:cytochrome P450
LFEDAAAFDLDRDNTRKHIAFGRGIHSCAGSNLARMEVRIALEILSQRLPSLRRAQGGPLQFAPSALQRAPKALRLTWN